MSVEAVVFPVAPDADAIAATVASLPIAIQDRLADLESSRMKYFADGHSHADHARMLIARRDDVRARMHHFDKQVRGGVEVSDADEKRRAGWAAQEKSLTSDIQKTQQRSDQRPKPYHESVIEDFLAGIAGRVVADARAEPYRGKDFDSALASAKAELKSAKTTLATAENAPLPLEQAERMWVNSVNLLAASGDPKAARCLKRVQSIRSDRVMQGAPEWPAKYLREGLTADAGNAFVAWAFKDQLIARGLEDIRAAHDPAKSLTDDERLEAIIVAKAGVLEAERAVVSVIDAMRERGIAVEYPQELSPESVIGVSFAD